MPATQAVGQFVAGQVANIGGSGTSGGIGAAVSQFGNWILPVGDLPHSQAIVTFLQGGLSSQQFNLVNRLAGIDITILDRGAYQLAQGIGNTVCQLNVPNLNRQMLPNERIIQFTHYTPSIAETLQMYNRQVITDDLALFYISQNCNGEYALAESWFQLRYEIPGPSDLIRFAVRDAFSPEAVQTFEYHKEFPIMIAPWLEKQGYGQVLDIRIPPGATTTAGIDERQNATWMDMYWWSHWDLPSPTQAYSMFQRFYATSRYGPSPEYNPEIKFESAQLELLLKTADYPTYWRKRLTALAYNVLTRVDTRRMYDIGVLDEAGVYHAYRAQGYSDLNAYRLLQFTIKLKQDKQLKKLKYLTLKDIEFLYLNQAVPIAEIKGYLRDIGIKDHDAELAIKGFEVHKTMEQLRTAISEAKHGYMTGLFNFDQVHQVLAGSGLGIPRVTELIIAWNSERFVKRRYLSAKDAMQMAVDGLIFEPALRTKLTNLNYTKDEIDAMVQQVYFKLSVLFGKSQEKQAKINAAQQKQSLKNLLAPYTDKNIKTWYTKSLITLKDVVTLFKLREWKKEAIINWITSELGEEVELDELGEIEEENVDDELDEENVEENVDENEA